MRTPVLPLLTDEILQEIGRIGRDRAPSEACGVITHVPLKGSFVFEMPNRSLEHLNTYAMRMGDIMETLMAVGWNNSRECWGDDLLDADLAWRQLALWHTHPSGNVSPSRVDMQSKQKNLHYIVVGLTPKGPQATWY